MSNITLSMGSKKISSSNKYDAVFASIMVGVSVGGVIGGGIFALGGAIIGGLVGAFVLNK